MILIIMKASDQKQQRGHTLNFCTVTLPSLCACVFFALSTDRASTIILRFSRGCQSDTCACSVFIKLHTIISIVVLSR